MNPIYTQDFKKLKKSELIMLAISIISLIVALIALYPQIKPNQNADLSIKQQDCTKNGLTAVQQYEKDNQSKVLDSPNFHFNKNLNKCYAYLEVYPYFMCESARIVFDVDQNKEILTACFTNNGEIRYADSSKYPVEIINQLDFVARKNTLLELQSSN